MTDEKTGRPLGPTGEAVRQNIRRIRESGRVPVTELSARLEALGRPIPPLGIRRIEGGQRRVDTDDLVAFAVALGVSPATLLMPKMDSAAPASKVPVLDASRGKVTAGELWEWLTADYPLPTKYGFADEWAFAFRAWPQWMHEEVRRRHAQWRKEVEDDLFRRQPRRVSPDGDD